MLSRLHNPGLFARLIRAKALELEIPLGVLLSELNDHFYKGRQDNINRRITIEEESQLLEQINALDWSIIIDKARTRVLKRRTRDGNGNPT